MKKKKNIFVYIYKKIHQKYINLSDLAIIFFKNWKCNNVEVKSHLMGTLRLYFCWEFLDPRTSWRKSTSEITCNEISILFYFPHAFAFINFGTSRIKNKVILIKYSRPIGMFPATQFWVATHRLRTTALEKYPVSLQYLGPNLTLLSIQSCSAR
jgi:hypothetical protein